MFKPADIANQALDAIGSETTIGDLEEGSREARVLLRHYGPLLRELLRAAHWNFARAQAPLELLADATKQNLTVPSVVQRPWSYAYGLPTDCLLPRFVPSAPHSDVGIPTGNTAVPNLPMTTASDNPGRQNQRLIPARFLVASDPNFPPLPGQEWFVTQGVAPNARTVVMTNVRHAELVYTKLVPWPSLWDSQFREAFIAALAAKITMALVPDKKFAAGLRSTQIAIARDKITAARISDGNEGWYSTNREASWIASRNAGSEWTRVGGYNGGDGPGSMGYGYEAFGCGDGSSF